MRKHTVRIAMCLLSLTSSGTTVGWASTTRTITGEQGGPWRLVLIHYEATDKRMEYSLLFIFLHRLRMSNPWKYCDPILLSLFRVYLPPVPPRAPWHSRSYNSFACCVFYSHPFITISYSCLLSVRTLHGVVAVDTVVCFDWHPCTFLVKAFYFTPDDPIRCLTLDFFGTSLFLLLCALTLRVFLPHFIYCDTTRVIYTLILSRRFPMICFPFPTFPTLLHCVW